MKTRDLSQTQKISFIGKEKKTRAQAVLEDVRDALLEKGYDPALQIAGYIMSGDPTYITSYNNARSMIGRLERDEVLEELVNFYFANKR